MVDRCTSAVVAESETQQTSVQDRRPCEVISQTPGYSTLVSVNAPLQLGGRSNPKVRYPDSVIRDGFDGCIKNLYHNGQVSSTVLPRIEARPVMEAKYRTFTVACKCDYDESISCKAYWRKLILLANLYKTVTVKWLDKSLSFENLQFFHMYRKNIDKKPTLLSRCF